MNREKRRLIVVGVMCVRVDLASQLDFELNDSSQRIYFVQFDFQVYYGESDGSFLDLLVEDGRTLVG